jgi:hypothetical protein
MERFKPFGCRISGLLLAGNSLNLWNLSNLRIVSTSGSGLKNKTTQAEAWAQFPRPFLLRPTDYGGQVGPNHASTGGNRLHRTSSGEPQSQRVLPVRDWCWRSADHPLGTDDRRELIDLRRGKERLRLITLRQRIHPEDGFSRLHEVELISGK